MPSLKGAKAFFENIWDLGVAAANTSKVNGVLKTAEEAMAPLLKKWPADAGSAAGGYLARDFAVQEMNKIGKYATYGAIAGGAKGTYDWATGNSGSGFIGSVVGGAVKGGLLGGTIRAGMSMRQAYKGMKMPHGSAGWASVLDANKVAKTGIVGEKVSANAAKNPIDSGFYAQKGGKEAVDKASDLLKEKLNLNYARDTAPLQNAGRRASRGRPSTARPSRTNKTSPPIWSPYRQSLYQAKDWLRDVGGDLRHFLRHPLGYLGIGKTSAEGSEMLRRTLSGKHPRYLK